MVRGRGPQPVIATDADGNETRYPSLKAAAEAIGARPSEISMACANGYRCKGFCFRKAEKNNQPLTKMQASVVLAYAHNGMRVQTAARVLYLHNNSVEYSLDRAREKTGKDPRNFFDLWELVQIARKVLEDEN